MALPICPLDRVFMVVQLGRRSQPGDATWSGREPLARSPRPWATLIGVWDLHLAVSRGAGANAIARFVIRAGRCLDLCFSSLVRSGPGQAVSAL
jgi:hypothetical protein